MGVNKVILLGNLGKDPELRYTSGQTAVCSFSLATGERRKDASGTWVDHTEWHNIVTFGKTAENCKNFLAKGRQAFVEGRIQTRKWQDKEGKDRYTTEIVANTVQFIGGKGAGTAAAVESSAQSDAGKFVDALPTADSLAGGGGQDAPIAFEEDDIPF